MLPKDDKLGTASTEPASNGTCPHPSFAVIPAAQAALVKPISLWLADVVGPNTLTRRRGRGLRRVLACFSSCFDSASTIHNPCPISGCKGVCTSSLGFLLRPRSLCVLLRPISCNDGPTTLQGSGCGSKRKDSQLAGSCSPVAVVAVSLAAAAGSSAIHRGGMELWFSHIAGRVRLESSFSDVCPANSRWPRWPQGGRGSPRRSPSPSWGEGNTKLTAETLYPRRRPACFVEIRDAGLKLTGVLRRWGLPRADRDTAGGRESTTQRKGGHDIAHIRVREKKGLVCSLLHAPRAGIPMMLHKAGPHPVGRGWVQRGMLWPASLDWYCSGCGFHSRGAVFNKLLLLS